MLPHIDAVDQLFSTFITPHKNLGASKEPPNNLVSLQYIALYNSITNNDNYVQKLKRVPLTLVV